MRNSTCTKCTLCQDARTVCLWGSGPRICRVMIVGEAPGATEDLQGIPFVGDAGQVLRTALKKAGLDPDECYITNAVKCRPEDNRTPKKKEIKACNEYLLNEIESVGPEFILILGNTALEALLNIKGITKLRGKTMPMEGVTYFATYHPAYVLRDPGAEPVFQGDLTAFANLVKGKQTGIEDISYQIVNTPSTFKAMAMNLVGTVSFDIETTCLYPWAKQAEITQIGFGTRNENWILPAYYLEEVIDELDEVVRDCSLVCHNGKFDLLWMKVHYGVTWRQDHDTMLQHYLLNENSKHGLKLLATAEFGAPDYDVDLQTKLGQGDQEHLAQYHAGDLYYTRKLCLKYKPQLVESHVDPVYKHLLMPMSNAFVDMEYEGVYIDMDQFGETESYLLNKIELAEKELNNYGSINWSSTNQLRQILFEELALKPLDLTPTGEPSTSESVLKRLDHPLVSSLLEYRAAKQQYNFFIKGWKPYLKNGRLHPNFKLHGTVTGRFSCENPNLQQVPRDPRIRSMITAPPGWVLMEADLSQIELRLVAEFSQDPEMLSAFQKDEDIHWRTAINEIWSSGAFPDLVVQTGETLSGRSLKYGDAIELILKAGPEKCEEIDRSWKEIRKLAKAINFGYVYGMWWKKFREYARDNYGVAITDQAAKTSRGNFFELYSRLEPWHKKQRSFAEAYGYVRSLLGRKRRLPDAMAQFDSPAKQQALRQSINSPIQSLASDLNVLALLELISLYPRSILKCVGTVHDAILAMIREDMALEIAEQTLRIMSKPRALKEAFNVEIGVPIKADVKLGPWSKGVSLEKYRASKSQ